MNWNCGFFSRRSSSLALSSCPSAVKSFPDSLFYKNQETLVYGRETTPPPNTLQVQLKKAPPRDPKGCWTAKLFFLVIHLTRGPPFIHRFDFCGPSYSGSTAVRKPDMENSRTRISFKLPAILISMMNFQAVLLLPIHATNQPLILQCLGVGALAHSSLSSHLAYPIDCHSVTVPVFK